MPKIVAKAHANNLRVSTHVSNAADFHYAVAAGVDEIAHIPLLGPALMSTDDVKLAARLRIVVDTTCNLALKLPRTILPEDLVPEVLKNQRENQKLLQGNAIRLAIGSDDVTDTSIKEIEYLKEIGVFDNLTLLKMWTETTAQTIFPNRKIGSLKEGYEASFLALEGNPIKDLRNVRKIRMRFKQGFLQVERSLSRASPRNQQTASSVFKNAQSN